MTQLRDRALRLGVRIDAPAHAYPEFGVRRDGGDMSLEDRDGRWVFEAFERGELCVRYESAADADALYWVMRHVTRDMASRWELEHRVPDTDSRAGWAGKQLELLRALDASWPARFRREEASWLDTVCWP